MNIPLLFATIFLHNTHLIEKHTDGKLIKMIDWYSGYNVFYIYVLLLIMGLSAIILNLQNLIYFSVFGVYVINVFCLYASYVRKRYIDVLFILLLISATGGLFIFIYTWSGFGRLLFAKYFIVILFVWSPVLTKKRNTIIKTLILFLFPVIVGVSGILRVQQLRPNEYDLNKSITTGEGAGSIFSTMEHSELVVNHIMDERYELLYGESYLATIFFWIPRNLWPNKPVGFGKQMVKWIQPNLYHTNHSLAGNYVAEAVANYGYFGYILAIAMIYIVIKLMSYYVKSNNIYKIIIAVIYIVSIPDLIWGGFFSFFVRATLSSMFCVVIIFFMKKIIIYLYLF
ncbi:hypothetical protein Ctha_2143 [Chloroherpeton thalassium ATCC 35110]|uniref:O-antigen polymerase n=1 Tax=Chloroherpeton thalassium (strain ATCC 35110 / GB-78) TaxID=517418 RepID=B3QVJ5_CHLT3|nr:hypothetical protein [Chloroherpeton thalassium]ACF14595.1 hypothetical protein Ctha_2143 [Chloroherpeton thalassium ATCC 35110]